MNSSIKIEGNGNRTMLLIPGGPGLPHVYLDPVFHSFDKSEFQVVTYSPLQEANGEYSMKLATKELDWVIQEYCLNETVILGHSFGGNLALEYLTSEHPSEKIQALITSNTIHSFYKYNKNIDRLRSLLPVNVNSRLKDFENKKDFGTEYFNLIMQEFLPRYLCTTQPLPEVFQKALIELDQSIFLHFVGENPLFVDGELANWSLEARLQDIKIPCLFLAGMNDTVFEEDIELMASKANGEFYLCPDSAHYPFLENQEDYSLRINSFLKSYDRK